MAHRFADIAFTPAVQALQERHGSRMQYARMQARGRTNESLGPREAAFLGEADSFHMATVSETGWPYVQHRGGPKGFVRVLSPTRLAFPDFRGNLQFVSAGNATLNDRVSLIFIDYANPQRLKLFGHLRFIDVAAADPELLRAVELPHYPARVERVALIDVVAFDWNCPQHITPRFTRNQLTVATDATVVTAGARALAPDTTARNAPPADTPAPLMPVT
jgi:uncharacterized protein